MALQFPNRTSQGGTYKTGSPNYVECGAGAAQTGIFTFPAKATDDSWADGDTVGVVVAKDNSNYWVGTATWDATNSYLELTTVEEMVGTLSDADAVTVSAVLTSTGISEIYALAVDARFTAESGTTRTLTAADHGATIRCTAATAVTITCDDALPVDFHCLVVQEGAGTVSVAIEGTDTVNGDTTAIDIQQQWASAYIYQPVEGEWVVVA